MHHLGGMGGTFSPLAFFGIGDTEMLVIMAAVLIFFGGQKMPELAKGLGKLLREFKRATGEVEREFKRVMDEAENPPPTYPPYTPAEHSLPAAPVEGEQTALDQPREVAADVPAAAVGAANEIAAETGQGILDAPAPPKPVPKRIVDDEYHSDV